MLPSPATGGSCSERWGKVSPDTMLSTRQFGRGLQLRRPHRLRGLALDLTAQEVQRAGCVRSEGSNCEV